MFMGNFIVIKSSVPSTLKDNFTVTLNKIPVIL